MSKQFDKIIIGAGLYGLYASLVCGEKGEKVLDVAAKTYQAIHVIVGFDNIDNNDPSFS